jgi:hypothetical protein
MNESPNQPTINYERDPSPTDERDPSPTDESNPKDESNPMVNKIIRTIKNENAEDTTPLLSTPSEEEKKDDSPGDIKKVSTK